MVRPLGDFSSLKISFSALAVFGVIDRKDV